MGCACQAAGIGRKTAYEARENDEDFAIAWDQALEDGVDVLERAALERATRSSDQLLVHLLKARRPGVHADRLRAELTGAEGGPISIEGRLKRERGLEADAIQALTKLLERLEAHEQAKSRRAASG